VSIERTRDDRFAVDARVTTARGVVGEARLRGDHTNLVALLRDGAPLPLPAWARERAPAAAPPASLAQALALAEALGPDDEDALLEGLEVNLDAARAAGAVLGPYEDAAEEAGALAEAAAYARMQGRRLTVVTSGWSGNQGLVASIPVGVVGRRLGLPPRDLARGLATSHLVGALLREGTPSPLCHALVAASAGAAAGCARLLGRGPGPIERAAQLALATAGAAACDGAKPACALRVGLAAAQAVRAARRAVAATPCDAVGGLVGATLEETARRLAVAAAQLAGGPTCGA
jgi:hypothetical protein